MEKRIFIAVLISIAFLGAWGYIIPKFFPDLVKQPQRKPSTAGAKQAGGASTTAQPAQIPPPEEAAPARVPAPAAAPASVRPLSAGKQVHTVIEQPDYVATFSNRGAQLVSFELKLYREPKGEPVELVKPRARGRADYPFSLETANAQLTRESNESLYAVTDAREGGDRVLRYRLVTPAGVEIVKTFRLGPSYRFDFDIAVRGDVPYRVMIGPGISTVSGLEKDTQFLTTGNGAYQIDGSFEVLQREKAPGFKELDAEVDFIGIEDNYFLTALIPQTAGEGVFRTAKFPVPGLKEPRKEIYAGVNAEAGRVAGKAFFGPKKAEILEAFGLDRTLKFGMFGFIARLLLTALVWLYGLTKNYGWAIIVLTVIIKILLYPLQHKSIVSMKKMQQVQPKVNAIKDKYKKAKTDAEQRNKMNQEMMKLYQQEGINPMSGCLPILLQLPILWAFYSLLSNSIELRGADFMGWISDLSLKDPYYITPVLMTATMFMQQWMTPTTADPAQKRIFMMMPLVFGFIFKDFPSGLVLYWLVQNVLSIVQQMIMNRYWKEHPVELRTVKER